MAIIQPFSLGSRGPENVFYNILERKNAFLGYKKKVQKVETLTFHFVHGFGPFYCRQYSLRKRVL